MKPAPFAFHRATSLEDALDALHGAEGLAKVLAGGQSLVPMLNLRLAPIDLLVDLSRVAALRETAEEAGAIRYGALTPHAAFEDGLVPDATNGLMPHVARRIAYRAVRTRGTIGGALALADPAADWLTTSIALDASVTVVGSGGRRSLPVADLVLGPYFAMLEDDEIIESVTVPRRPASERWGYSKVAMKVGEYAKALAIVLRDDAAGTCRAVLGALEGSAPVTLPHSAQAIRDGCAGADLGAIVHEELTQGGIEMTAAQRTMYSTTVVRAAREARE